MRRNESVNATPALAELVEEHERAATEAAKARAEIAERGLGSADLPQAKTLPSKVGDLQEWNATKREREEAALAALNAERLGEPARRELEDRIDEAEDEMHAAVLRMLEAGMPPEVWVRVGDRGGILTEEDSDRTARIATYRDPGRNPLASVVLGISRSPMPLAKAARLWETTEDEALERVRKAAKHISSYGLFHPEELRQRAREFMRREAAVEPGRLRLALAPWKDVMRFPDEAPVAQVVRGYRRTEALAQALAWMLWSRPYASPDGELERVVITAGVLLFTLGMTAIFFVVGAVLADVLLVNNGFPDLGGAATAADLAGGTLTAALWVLFLWWLD